MGLDKDIIEKEFGLPLALSVPI